LSAGLFAGLLKNLWMMNLHEFWEEVNPLDNKNLLSARRNGTIGTRRIMLVDRQQDLTRIFFPIKNNVHPFWRRRSVLLSAF